MPPNNDLVLTCCISNASVQISKMFATNQRTGRCNPTTTTQSRHSSTSQSTSQPTITRTTGIISYLKKYRWGFVSIIPFLWLASTLHARLLSSSSKIEMEVAEENQVRIEGMMELSSTGGLTFDRACVLLDCANQLESLHRAKASRTFPIHKQMRAMYHNRECLLLP